MQAGLAQIQKEVRDNAQKIAEAEQRIATLECKLSDSMNRIQAAEAQAATIADKMDDMENKARRHNLRIVSLPEHVKAT